MTQWIIYVIQWAIVIGFIGALLYRPKPERRGSLRKTRAAGCLSGGCLLPILLLIVVFANARGATDLGGPLFWPAFAALGAAFGFAMATLYFIVFRRDK